MTFNLKPEDPYGFIYITKVYNLNKFYIGKKTIKTKNKQYGYSKWENYMGSNEVIKENRDNCIKCILYWTTSKINTTYKEVEYQFKYNVIDDDDFLNKNILGKFYRTE